jgi:hypothetical protein
LEIFYVKLLHKNDFPEESGPTIAKGAILIFVGSDARKLIASGVIVISPVD